MFLMPIFWLLILVGAIIVVVAAAQSGSGTTAPQSPETALDILKKRYARGEIGAKEYEEKKSELIK
ncbi:MAG: SHOCT domain-containing protein [Actinomycetota bacterium]|nr:SHOCT domain-containing protein [Actinomycetota bacterium]